MKYVFVAICLCLYQAVAIAASTRVTVQDFEGQVELPKVWVVNMPEGSSTSELSTQSVTDGKQSLKLNYQFTGDGQYLGVPVPVKIQNPVRLLRFQMFGDESSCGYGVYVTDASGETHKFRDPAGKVVNFNGWREVTIDLTAGHETWGGDKNGKINYPVSQIIFEIGTPGKAAQGSLYFDAVSVDGEGLAEASSIAVTSPEYRSDVKGDTKIEVTAKGYKSLTVKSWKPGGRFGSIATVGTVNLDEKGAGSFTFPADDFPHGPITVTISGEAGKQKDNCYLQLYNKGGTSVAGIPKSTPPGAKGLELLFSDDFDGPLSIGGGNAKYYDHKPPHGQTDFSFPLQFVSHDKPNTPFAQMDSFLRIRASDKAKSAGLISSVQSDGSGFMVKAPAYFECNFLGPNAIGSWPAFWLMTDHFSGDMDPKKTGSDELDIIEAYGGEGPKTPNAYDKFMISPHCWNQGDDGKKWQEAAVKTLKRPIEMKKLGIASTWYESFHTYGCLVTETETVYYCDDIEMGRHKTLPLSKEKSLFFMVNLAVGGGWPVDLSRYGGEIDMYVDYIRVYGKK